MMTLSKKYSLLSFFSMTAILLPVGCDSVRVQMNELTPNMETLSQTHTDADVDLTMTDNQDWRMAEEDLGRVWYTNRPSRLSPYPVINTTGNPQ